jgi:hypothetical protein
MKKVIVTLLSLTALGIGAAVPLQAQAESIQLGYPGLSINLGHKVQRQFNVYYRYDRFDEWQLAGSYQDYDDADYVARRFERRGYVSRIEPNFEPRFDRHW